MEEAITEHDPSLGRAAAALSARLIRDEPALLSSGAFGSLVRAGEGEGPRLLCGDRTGVPMIPPQTGSRFDHRMALLASSGDAVLVRRREPAFEAYLRHVLCVTDVTFMDASFEADQPLLAHARTDNALFDKIETALGGAACTIMPYQTTGHAWRLAQALSQRSGAPVHVAGPWPRVARRANDKLWFANLARDVLGKDAVPPTSAAYGPAAAAGLVRHFARDAEDVIVKVPDSAGSAGNLRLSGDWTRSRPLKQLRDLLQARLGAMGWNGVYPLLVGVWDKNVISSPSVQMLIPRLSEGAPVSYGVFEQTLEGATAKFAGAAPMNASFGLIERLEQEALRIADVLQRIGYFGPCSFDAVVTASVDQSAAEADIHWIECNGRWTGVSIPLVAATGLLGERPAGIVVVQEESRRSGGVTTDWLIRRMADLLFAPGESQGVILTAPPSACENPVVAFTAISDDQDAARWLAAEALARIS